MPLVTDPAVCLRVSPFSETSQVVTLFTASCGKIRLLAKGARRRTRAGFGKFDGGLDLLDRGYATFSHAPARDLVLLTEWGLTDGNPMLRGNARALWLALFAAECVDVLTAEHDPSPRLYEQATRLLDRLGQTASPDVTLLAFLLNLLRQGGILPDFARTTLPDGSDTPTTGLLRVGKPVFFDAATASLVTDDAPGRGRLTSEGAKVLFGLLRRAGQADAPAGDAQRAAGTGDVLRLLVAHVEAQTNRRMRTARYVLRPPGGPDDPLSLPPASSTMSR